MTQPRDDPSRRCMKLADWPRADREAWQAAISTGSVLMDAGLACRWSQGHRDRIIQSYGRYLAFLESNGHLDPAAGPGARLIPEVIIAFGERLRRDCAPVTVFGYLNHLRHAVRVMAPGVDLSWLRKVAARLKARAKPSRDKRNRTVPAEDLLRLGLAMMGQAREHDQRPGRKWTLRYRDGLIIALLALRPIRRRSFVLMAVSRHLVRKPVGYQMRFAAEEMKGRRAYEVALPQMLTPYMDHYLAEVRPRLLAGHERDDLWLAWGGRAFTGDSLYGRLRQATSRAFGVALGPHMFRDCAATSIALDDPDHVQIIAPLLAHGSLRTGEAHYNQAGSMQAATLHATLINDRRQASRRKTRTKIRN